MAKHKTPLELIHETFPLEQYLEGFVALNCHVWIRKLPEGSSSRQEFEKLVLDEDGEPRMDPGKNVIQKIAECIKRHPELAAIVDKEYAAQCKHMVRWITNRPTEEGAKVKSDEWKKLYKRLLEIISRHGNNDAFGNGDFFLIDDEYEEPAHKIEVTNPEKLTPIFVGEVQKALKGWKNRWCVLVQLALDDMNLDLDAAGLDIWQDEIEEDWNKDELRRVLGKRFKF